MSATEAWQFLLSIGLILVIFTLAWLAGRSCRPITEAERYDFNGQPTRCIDCGNPMIRTEFTDRKGRWVTIRCEKYKGDPDRHEWYRWCEIP